MEKQLQWKETGSSAPASGLGNVLAALVITIIALTEWASWSLNTSFIRIIWPALSAPTSFYIAITLLALSLISIAVSNGIHKMLSHAAFLYYRGKAIVKWPAFKKNMLELLIAVPMAMLTIKLLLSTLHTPMEHLDTITGKVSWSYLFCLLLVLLNFARIPRVMVINAPSGWAGMGKDEIYAVIDGTNSVVYTFDEVANQWVRAADIVIINGERFVVLSPMNTLSLVQKIEIQNAAFEVTIQVRLVPLISNYPKVIGNDTLRGMEHWLTSSKEDRKQLLEISSTGLIKNFDQFVKQMFGINEQGQFMFDNLSRIIKESTKRGLATLDQIDLRTLARQLETNLTSSFIGLNQNARPIFSTEVSIVSHQFKGQFKELNDYIKDITGRNNIFSTELRGDVIRKLVELYTTFCPMTDSKDIAQLLGTLFSDPGVVTSPVPVTETMTPVFINPTLHASQDDAQAVSLQLSDIGRWLRALPNRTQRLADGHLVNDVYFQLLDRDLVRQVRPGLSPAGLRIELNKTLPIPLDELMEGAGRLYTDDAYRLSIASQFKGGNYA